jgi:hypothetical protein
MLKIRFNTYSKATRMLIQIKARTPNLMMLGNIGAVHGHSLLIEKQPEKASRVTLRC